MAYTKQTWANGVAGSTPVNADRLNHLETQYEEAVADIRDGAPANLNTLNALAAAIADDPTFAATVTNALAAKITAFADPDADRIVFWDDSAGEYAALAASTGLTISGTSMTVRSASESQTGIVEMATTAEATTGSDTSRAVTAAGLTAFLNGAGVPRGTGSTKYRMVACTLRRVNTTTWEILDDAGHTPTGVSSVSITSTYVRLTYNFTASAVVTGICTPDESFAAVAGMRIGASVGLSYMDIYTYISTNTTPSDPGLLSTANANIWVWGLFEVA